MLDGDRIVLAGAVALSALAQAATGFGFGLLVVPLLTLATTPESAVVLTLVFGAVATAVMAARERRDVDRPAAARLAATALVGLPVGVLVYERTSTAGLQVAIGVLIIGSAIALHAGLELPARPSVDLVGGLAAGVLNTSTGTGGPPVVAVLQGRRLRPAPFRATANVVFFVIDVAALAGYAATGQVSARLLVVALLTLPAMAAGAWVGVQVRDLVPTAAFRLVVLTMLGGSGVAALLTALL